MIEAMLLPIMVRIVKFTGKVVEPSYFVRVQPRIRAALGRRSSELVIRGVRNHLAESRSISRLGLVLDCS